MRRTGPARPARPALLALVVAMALVGCGSSGGREGARATTTTPRSSSTTTSTPSTSTTAGTDTTAGGEPPTTGTTRPVPTTGPEGLQFRPVIGSQPCSSVHPDSYYDDQAAGGSIPSTTVPPPGKPDLLEDATGTTCYGVGPAGGDGTDLTSAEAVLGQDGQWQVSVRTRAASVDKLNALFDACYEATPTCPASSGAGANGTVAIVVDGTVISAPQVNGPDLADDTFQLTGTFTKAEAEALAARLDG